MNCPYTPGGSERDTVGGFEVLEPFLLAAINKAFSAEERGVDSTETWDLANDIMMVNFHIMMAGMEMNRNYQATGDPDYAAVRVKYKIDCIRKTLACKGFDIDPLLLYYGVRNGGYDGIDFMNIEDGNNPWEILSH